MNTSRPTPQDRQIRVFISSTFRDMQAERDHLVKFIFPQLRKLCESRGVTWGEVDLRWGVTDEQAAEGKVLPICLEEIKRCRPYFIGLLGERYGWIPEAIPAEVIERETWLKEHLHGKKSVTELEIIHGVLRNEEMHGHAYFYFRNPKYLAQVPEEKQSDFTSENAQSAEKLEQLKKEIRRARDEQVCKLREGKRRRGYSNPKVLGRIILRDFTKLISDKWPEGSQPDPLDREAMDHEAYAQSRERVYIGRQEYFDHLDAYASGGAENSSPSPPAAGGEGRGEVGNENKPLVILGESGSGKSALLANWVARYRQAHPDALVLQHYIGATPYSADWAAMLRRLMGEFKRRLGLQQDIPDQLDAMRSAFPNWLYMANAKVESSELRVESSAFTRPEPPESGTPNQPLTRPADTLSPSDGERDGVRGAPPDKIIIVLDALNQLEDRDGAPDLVWLPPVLPENVRLIVSTLPGRPLDEIQKRKWPALKVELLSADERRKLIAEYLAQHAKSLNAARVERIATAPPSANPLYLRVLLDELRLVRTHEELEERIGDYLKAESPYALYEKVIARWEQDYEGDTDLVSDTLSLLWAARRGLTETELLQVLGKDGEPLPRAKWSPLFLAMSDALISRGGLLTFAHDFLRTATKNAYLPTEQNQQQAHLRLADYFERQPASPRRTDELPWQLGEAHAWQRLYDLLADIHFLDHAWEGNQFDVKGYWAKIEHYSPLRMVDAYQVDQLPSLREARYVPILLYDTGRTKESFALQERLLSFYRSSGDSENMQRGLGVLGKALYTLGRLDEAMSTYREREQICRDNGDQEKLQETLHNQASVLIRRHDHAAAMQMLEEVERICTEQGHSEGLAQCLGSIGFIHFHVGDLNQAIAAFKRQEQIAHQTGNKQELASARGSQGNVYSDMGYLDEALALHKEQETISREIGQWDGVQGSLCNQATVLFKLGRYGEAMRLQSEEERICREIGNLNALHECLANQATVLIARGQREAAMAALKQEELILREMDDKSELRRCLEKQNEICTDEERYKFRGDNMVMLAVAIGVLAVRYLGIVSWPWYVVVPIALILPAVIASVVSSILRMWR
jgi:nephrocystin-3